LCSAKERAPSLAAGQVEVLRRAPELAAERQGLDAWLAAAPDKVLALVAQMDDPAAMPAGTGPVTYACPMHPEVTSEQPGRCPKCGMKLLATQVSSAPTSDVCPMHPEVTSAASCRTWGGMKLLASRTSGQPQGGHKDVTMHHDDAAMHHGTAHAAHGAAIGHRAERHDVQLQRRARAAGSPVTTNPPEGIMQAIGRQSLADRSTDPSAKRARMVQTGR